MKENIKKYKIDNQQITDLQELLGQRKSKKKLGEMRYKV
jgi:hypothetical protein